MNGAQRLLGLLIIIVCVAAWSLGTAGQADDSQATRIIQRYLKLPHPEKDTSGKARSARFEVLAELKAIPEEAVPAIGRALSEVKHARQRRELAGTLADHFHTKASAELLCGLLKDPDEDVRGQAIHGLRMMARRTDRTGGKRIVRRPDFAPKVEGLVPYLISAADDASEGNRVSAMYGLADSRDPAAVEELRRRLKDPSERVRFAAACFLTEFHDASGLPVMRRALDRLRKSDSDDDFRYYSNAELLLASMERITGKGFGKIPLNPVLCSNLNLIPKIKRRYWELLDTWAQWWAWEPQTEKR
jgi:hypothetical protein